MKDDGGDVLEEELRRLGDGARTWQQVAGTGVSVLRVGKIRQEQNTRRAEAIVCRTLEDISM